LETTIPDRSAWEGAIHKALQDAQFDDLPEGFDELVPFVRVYLATYLDDEERPWLISSVLEELEAEAELSRADGELNSSARMAIATRIPDRIPTQPAPAIDEEFEEPPSAQIPIPQVVPKAPSMPRFVAPQGRPAVLVVDGDRFKRSALARTLVQFRCDVTVLDGGEEAISTVSGPDPIDVLVLDVDAPAATALLEALVASRPAVPVLAWTNAPASAAEHVVRTAGVRAVAVAGRSALNSEINEALRKLLEE
jgi:CheY-like chemotaxis protein